MGERVEYEDVDAGYLEQRSLQRTAGPVLLWGLGVGYVISGDYFGWSYGLNAGGFGGLLIATAIMATLYVTMIFSIAELATAMPVAGGPYAFARRALGPWGGYLTGLAVTIEYVVAPAVIATGIGGYVAGMFPAAPGWVEVWVPVVAYAIFVGVSLMGSKVSLRLLLGITAISVVVLVVWAAAMLPHLQWSRLLDIPAEPGGSSFLPKGGLGVLAALPAAGWFYLAIEGVPLAAEETRDPARDLPRGMIAAMLSLVAFSVLALLLGPAAAGSRALAQSANPLPAAVEAVSGRGAIYWMTTVVGLAGLVASFFGIIFAVGGLGVLGYLTLSSQLLYADLGPTPANIIIGALSAIVDNIPLMFAVLTMDPQMSDGQWLLITLTCGVGGSMLSIGSAAGVALMGQARGLYTFMSHIKWTWAIALGYAASIAVHMLVNSHLF